MDSAQLAVTVGHKNTTDTKCHSMHSGDIVPLMLVLRCLWLIVDELMQADQGSLTININKVSTVTYQPSSQPVHNYSKPKRSIKEYQGGTRRMEITGEEDTQGQCLLPDDKSGLLVALVMLRLARLGSPLSL